MGAKSPEDMMSVWTDAFNRGDLEAIVELYEPEAVLARSSGPPRKILSTADLALCYREWSLRGTNADGTARAASGKSVEILRKQSDGSWCYILDDPFSTGVS